MLLRSSRATDLAARVGGEEFALILPETAPGNALHVAERLRARLAKTMITWNRDIFSITCSAGVCGGVGLGLSADPGEMYRQADEALYAAKTAGRNRVSAAHFRRSFTAAGAGEDGRRRGP